MLRKKEVYTQITPLPSTIPRQLAIDMLHNHSEIITLNPLVLEHHPIKAPRDAAADEFYSTWYEITERIQYLPGMGKMGSGKISFKGCFHDMPWGIQTHIYAPMNIDMRNNWRICGNQPDEPPEPKELGIGAPAEGLYLREDIEIRCNITMVSFVKSQMRSAAKIMVDRMIKKAELLDAGVLQAMFEDGKLKTINPADRSSVQRQNTGSYYNPLSPRLSPRMSYQPPMSPGGRPYSPGQVGAQYQTHQSWGPGAMPAQKYQEQPMVMELPGDFYHPSDGSVSGLHPSYSVSSQHSIGVQRYSTTSSTGSSADAHHARWSAHESAPSRPTSYSSAADGGIGVGGSARSPALDQKMFAAELPTHAETAEEHVNRDALLRLEGRDDLPPYNPQDYANVPPVQTGGPSYEKDGLLHPALR